jgi:hypothetical protein
LLIIGCHIYSYTLISRLCDRRIIVLNVHTAAQNKLSDARDSFCREVERVFSQFPKYRTKVFFLISVKKEGEMIF